MTNVANLVVKISADTKKLTTDLKTAETSVENFASKATGHFKLIGIGLASAATIGAGLFINKLLDTAAALDKLGDSAQAIGLTTRELQRLQFQAGLAGSSAEGLTQAFSFMLNAVADAASGSEQQVEAFKKLGLQANILKQLRPEEQFNRIAEAFRNVKNTADQVDISRTIFGRAGVDQINLLNSSLKESEALFAKLGLGLSEGLSESIDKLDKSRKTLDTITNDFGAKLAAGAAPGFNSVISGINETIEHFGGLGKVSDIISNVIISGISGIATAAKSLSNVFKGLGVIAEGVKVAGTTIGVGVAKIVSGNLRDNLKDDIAKEVLDPAIKKLAEGVNSFNKVNENSAAEVLIDNITKNLAKSGVAAEKSGKQVEGYGQALVNLSADIKKTELESSLKKVNAKFSDEENEFLNRLKAFSDTAKPKSESELQRTIINKLSELNTAESSAAILDIFKSIGNRANAERAGGTSGFGSITGADGRFMSIGTPQGTDVSGFGSITGEDGRFMSVGRNQQNVVVTVVLVPDEGRLFSAVVDSQIFERKVVETSNKNLIDVTRSDRQ